MKQCLKNYNTDVKYIVQDKNSVWMGWRNYGYSEINKKTKKKTRLSFYSNIYINWKIYAWKYEDTNNQECHLLTFTHYYVFSICKVTSTFCTVCAMKSRKAVTNPRYTFAISITISRTVLHRVYKKAIEINVILKY